MNDIPITDAAEERCRESKGCVNLVFVDDMADLERQLAEARRRQGGPDVMDAVTVLDAINDLMSRAGITEGETTQRKVMALIEQRDRLAEALQWYQEQSENCNRHGKDGDNARDLLAKDYGRKAAEVLAAVKGGNRE